MSKLKMYQFMGSSKDRKEQEVTVTYDKSKITSKKPTKKTPDNPQESLGNNQANMSLAMSMGKDERLFRLETAFDQGEVFTISSAAELLQVSFATAKKYALELEIKLFDDHKKEYLNGRIPK